MAVVSKTKEWAVGYHPSVINCMACLCTDYLAATIFRASSPIGGTVTVRIDNGLFLEGFGVVLGAATVFHTWAARIVGTTGSMYHILDHDVL